MTPHEEFEFKSILDTARRLQVIRIQNAVRSGFYIPDELIQKYNNRYRIECDYQVNDQIRESTYKTLYYQFHEELTGYLPGLNDLLNILDFMTLFGEICTGEYSENIIGIYSAKTILN